MSMLKDTRTSLPGKDRPNAGERGHVKLTDVCATHPRNHHQKNASAHSCMEKSNCSKKKKYGSCFKSKQLLQCVDES